LYVWIFV